MTNRSFWSCLLLDQPMNRLVTCEYLNSWIWCLRMSLKFFVARMKDAEELEPKQYGDEMSELSTICAMCNDSSLDYNNVSVISILK